MAQRTFLDPKILAKLSRLPLLSRGLVEGAFSGMHRSPHKGSSVEFAQYREYVKGDDIRHVDWRVWGRTDRFYLKEFEADTNLRCHILIDRSASMGFGAPTPKIDYAKKMAAAIAHVAMRQGDAVGLVLFSDSIDVEIPPRHNPSHLRNIFDALERVGTAGKTDIPTVLHQVAEKIRRRALVIVISDLFEEPSEILPAFTHFCHRKHDLAVFHLIDPAELKFPFERPTCFIDMETSSRIIADPAILRREYLRSLTGYLEKLKSESLRSDVDYQLVRTDTPYDETLADFMTRRQAAGTR